MGDVTTIRKVLLYVVVDGRLAVFRHPDSPEAGIQVPAGTVKPNESDEQAALREAYEETGLTGSRLVAALGRELFDFSPFGRDELHDRAFFQLAVDSPVPAVWSSHEKHDGLAEPTRFDFFWLPLAEDVLIAGHGRLLGEIR